MNFRRMGKLPLSSYRCTAFPSLPSIPILISILSLKYYKNLKISYSINRTQHKRRSQLKWKRSSTFFSNGFEILKFTNSNPLFKSAKQFEIWVNQIFSSLFLYISFSKLENLKAEILYPWSFEYSQTDQISRIQSK